MRLLSAGLLSSLGTLVLFAACGFPDFQFDTEGEGGTTSSSTGIGGGTGGTTAGGTGGTSTGTAGSGGTPICSLYLAGDCGPNEKCTVLDPATGEIGCSFAGPKHTFERCNNDSDCVEGTWCDLALHTCKPWCQSMTDCSFDGGTYQGECVVALQQSGTQIPGSPKHCTANCEPISAAPCVKSDSVTCVFLGSGVFDCARSQNYTEGTACDVLDCAAGLACVGPDNSEECLYWCTPPAILGCGFSNCIPLNPVITYGGVEYGVCG